ncbi:hypothetical protein L7F22_012400 [Adiantum nelumboides]|nr:hypothetical protein [Adiantum nelumboides]
MAALAPVLGTTQDAPRPITWTYELTPEDETEMQTAIEHFSGRTLVGRLVGNTPSRPTVREWIESALGGSPARILELFMMMAGLFLLQLSDSVSTDALLARSPISSGSRLLVFQRWTPRFDQDEFDRKQQIPRLSVTLSFPSLPIFMRRCIPRMAARWGIVIPGSLVSEIGTPRIQVYALGDTQFPDLVHIRDRAGQIRAQRMVVTGRPDQCLRCHAFGHHARACPRQPQARRQAQAQAQAQAPPPGPTTEARWQQAPRRHTFRQRQQQTSVPPTRAPPPQASLTVSEVLNVKIIRNKQTMASEGYGFVEFVSHASAERILNTYNGSLMPQTEQIFRLNWASFGMGERRMEGSDLSIFVGDLAADVTDQLLQETFKSRYVSVKGARVVTDTLTGRSKGYGFVRFGDDAERTRAMTEMNGVYCSSRPMRINVATPKKALNQQQQYTPKASSSYQGHGSTAQSSSENDPNNTTVFVGGLDPNVKDQDLQHIFGQYGELVSVKIPVGKGCGFVQFVNRSSAEDAIQKLHGSLIGQQTVRLSWGRSPANKQTGQYGGWNQAQSDPSQWNPGYYTYNQGYEGYGYAPSLQDGSAYGYGSYPGYGTYPQQVS